jgi:hypothetical protein
MKEKKQTFSHETLTRLLYQMLHALKSLHVQGATFDDFRPLYVGQNEDKYILCEKLKDGRNDAEKLEYGRPDAKSIQTNNILDSNGPLYMSPQLFEGIIEKRENINHSAQKSDSFSLGAVVLQCGL